MIGFQVLFPICYSEMNTPVWKLDLFLSSGEWMRVAPIQLGPIERAILIHWIIIATL